MLSYNLENKLAKLCVCVWGGGGGGGGGAGAAGASKINMVLSFFFSRVDIYILLYILLLCKGNLTSDRLKSLTVSFHICSFIISQLLISQTLISQNTLLYQRIKFRQLSYFYFHFYSCFVSNC